MEKQPAHMPATDAPGTADPKQALVQTVCQLCGITPDMLALRTKRKPVTFARQIIAALLWERNLCSLREIARLTGVQRNSVYYLLRPPLRKRDRCDSELQDLFLSARMFQC